MIIAIASQKGGSGKSTTASTLWSEMNETLGIDLDVQGNFGTIINANPNVSNIYDVLKGDCSVSEAVQHLEQGDFIVSSPELADMSILKNNSLKDAIAPLEKKYQHIIIDTPPALNLIVTMALTCADALIIPINADPLSVGGLAQLKEIVEGIHATSNPNLLVAGVLLTRFNSRIILRQQMRDIAEQLASSMGSHVFKTTIRDTIAVSEAQAMHQPLTEYAPYSTASRDYLAFIDELKGVLKNA